MFSLIRMAPRTGPARTLRHLRGTATTTTASEDALSERELSAASSGPPRFYDSREKYLVFCTTTSEKWRVGERVIQELDKLEPRPPSINIFDAGLGDAAVLSRVLRGAHGLYPTVPICAVAKEISLEDVRQSLAKMPDRFSEHPQLVLSVTNLTYKSAPSLRPATQKGRDDLNWIEIPLKGNTAIHFERQIENKIRDLEAQEMWGVKHTAAGNPVPAKPCVLVMYREDQRFGLDQVLPQKNDTENWFSNGGYDLVIASQPFRSRASAESKVTNVLMPMMRSLKKRGRLVVVQSTGHDPAMEIVRNAWPQEEPFLTPGHVLQAEMLRHVNGDGSGLKADDFVFGDSDQFRYEMHSLPDAATDSIGTSLLLAAWNAATYVGQVEDHRSDEKVLSGEFQECVTDVLDKYGKLWFTKEAFVVSRKGE